MTHLLEQVMDRIQRLPPEAQDEIAHILLAYAGDDQDVIQLTPEQEASFAESLAQAGRRQFASDEQVEAVWAKVGL